MFVVALTQSIRSLLITFIPVAIVTFIAWAIAGSAYASTTDPFRGATWITLGTHAIPFNLQIPPSATAGWLTYLPLGAMILPAISIFTGARKVVEQIGSTSAAWLFAFDYVVLLLILAILSSNQDVTINWYWVIAFATPFVFLVTILAVNQLRFSLVFIYVIKIWSILLGFATLLLGISILINLNTVKQLTTVLQPGIFGGILLLLLTILYLPNFMIATLAYISGAGFAIGRDTLVAPFSFDLGKIPAIPILGALPTGAHPLYILAGLAIVAVGAWLAYVTLERDKLVLRQIIVLFLLSTFLIAYLGSGALITYQLGMVGPSLWKFPLALIGEFLLGVGIVVLLPRLIAVIGRR